MSDPTHRLDAELVRRGLARSRGRARELLDGGPVRLVGASTGGLTQVLPRHGAREVVERFGVNIRHTSAAELGGPAQLVVADLSPISLRLVTPQFEVGRGRLGKGGLVRSPVERAKVICEVASPIRGATGNAQYLLWCTPRAGAGLRRDQLAATAAELSREGPP